MPKHLRPRYDRRRLGALVVASLMVVGVATLVSRFVIAESGSSSTDVASDENAGSGGGQTGTAGGSSEEHGGDVVTASGFRTPGLLTFRGSPTRSYYGEGPVPQDPDVVWSYPQDVDGMCGMSTVREETTEWCGTGWTGQPSVFERDGRTWVVFGSYDHKVHFVDFDTGEAILPPYPTGDIVKGSETVDPDGYPLVYAGSRDDRLHVVAFDRSKPEQLWSLHAEDVSPTLWNNDWDGAPLVVDDYLYVGGENSQFHVVKLNRSYDDDGQVQVAPEVVFNAPGWDEQLLGDLRGGPEGDNVSIEGSVAYRDGVVYFANSGGLVQGWDVSGLPDGDEPKRVFRFWTGDDADATVVIDEEGFLYVASEYERGLPRADEVGQLVKLDPSQPDDPLVWSFHDPSPTVPRGFWATPGLHEDVVIAPSTSGVVFGIDRATGEKRWEIDRGEQTWSSPVIVDDVWIQGSCDQTLRAYDVSDPEVEPPELWSLPMEGCVESTPAVWDGRLFVGTRSPGLVYAIGDDK